MQRFQFFELVHFTRGFLMLDLWIVYLIILDTYANLTLFESPCFDWIIWLKLNYKRFSKLSIFHDLMKFIWYFTLIFDLIDSSLLNIALVIYHTLSLWFHEMNWWFDMVSVLNANIVAMLRDHLDNNQKSDLCHVFGNVHNWLFDMICRLSVIFTAL